MSNLVKKDRLSLLRVSAGVSNVARMTEASMRVPGAIPVFTRSDFLRKAREHAGLSQSELAELTGISRRTISRNEGGDVTLRRPQMIAWAMATGVSLEWLETGTERPRPDSPDGAAVRHQGLEPRTHWFRASVVELHAA